MPSKEELAKVHKALDTVRENDDAVSEKVKELSKALREYHMAGIRLKDAVANSTSISAGARQDIVDNMGIYVAYMFDKRDEYLKGKLERWAMLVFDKLADEVIAFEDAPEPSTVEAIRRKTLTRQRALRRYRQRRGY